MLELTSAALRFDDEEYDVADLVLLALADGSWQALAQRLARGLALEREHGPGIAPARVAAELTRVRYARRLIAAKELREWLAARALSLADLQRHCLRNLLLEEEHGLASGDGDAPPPERDLWVEAICSGTLHTALSRLGELAAMAASGDPVPPDDAEIAALVAAASPQLTTLGADDLRRRAHAILALLRAESAFTAATATAADVTRTLDQHGVDWLRADYSELLLNGEGAAREAILCMRVDGSSLEHLAQQLGTAIGSQRTYIADAATDAAALLASAPLGEPVGPFAAGEGWRVLVVRERTPPSADDPELVRRATAALMHAARERTKAGRVRELASF